MFKQETKSAFKIWYFLVSWCVSSLLFGCFDIPIYLQWSSKYKIHTLSSYYCFLSDPGPIMVYPSQQLTHPLTTWFEIWVIWPLVIRILRILMPIVIVDMVEDETRSLLNMELFPVLFPVFVTIGFAVFWSHFFHLLPLLGVLIAMWKRSLDFF